VESEHGERSVEEEKSRMFDYACGGYLVAKTTPSPDVVDDDDERTPEPDVAAKDEASSKTDDPG
jgi:hypothetical protein